MTEELFPAEAVEKLSPRLAWIKRRSVFTYHAPHMEEAPWCAWFGTSNPVAFVDEHGDEELGYGDTEDNAIASLALRQGWKLWFEEGEFIA